MLRVREEWRRFGLHVLSLHIDIDIDFDKGAGASEAPSQTKEEFSINDTSRDPKVLKIGPQHG